ncbi:MAG: aminotransferase class I/II-fold pyridoxal phosphate-dependent enzyme [Selenomonadaceae bacterium]|nr:aminotransferase class I/II-fold pyridoxal phosphate-dependent enzyme [Selenomonadaceae bacterium]
MKAFEHGGNIYGTDGQVEDWLDFSANINPLGLSETVKKAIFSGIDGLIHYPDPQARQLKNAIAARYNLPFEKLIALNGAAEGLYLYFNTFRPRRVLIVVPSFSEYERAALGAGCEVEYHLTEAADAFRVDFGALIKTVRAKDINCVVLGNPNNPTGTLLAVEDVERLLVTGVAVIVDESFVDFLGDSYSVRGLLKAYSNLIMLQSLTKFYAIPGLRLGFAAADRAIIEGLELNKDVWNVNLLAQRAGVAALSDVGYAEETRRLLEKESAYIRRRLSNDIGTLSRYGPTANFVLLRCESDEAGRRLVNGLRGRRVLIRSGEGWRGLGGRYVRVAVADRAANCELLHVVEGVIGRNR